MKSHPPSLAALAALPLLLGAALADGPADNIPERVRRIPRLGIDPDPPQRSAIERGLAELSGAMTALRSHQDQRVAELLPDISIFHDAVRGALTYHEFFDTSDIEGALELLEEGSRRARALARGEAPWTEQSGLVVRGYVSRIDGSVQPYGLVIPPDAVAGDPRKHRLDVWFHGRGETLGEVKFLLKRRRELGPYAPPDTIVLHPYGRYSNAFKFAGEVDVLEAIESVRRRYRIDDDRVAVRGFSMGGAACWQFAVHFADRWFAANPGAGFAETPEFLRIFQKETLSPTWFERKLWQLYDCTGWAANLYHCPTVAYSGELDVQKQAADIMAAALEDEGMNLVHIIGPATRHRIHPEARLEVERRLSSLAERGRERQPAEVHFVTYTLKYNRMHWVTVDALGEHWKRARVDATASDSRLVIHTENVTGLTLDMAPGWSLFAVDRPVRVQVDGTELQAPGPGSDRSWRFRLHLDAGRWAAGPAPEQGLRKRHDLQGPIDDAFMDSFLFVSPGGEPAHALPGKWAEAELAHATEHWRRQFRGHARVRRDRELTPEDLASASLVLWGDPSSNSVLARIADRLPIRWTRDAIVVGERRFDARDHGLILIYPNPLNPERYVVLNSGFTYREFAYLNNARQVPKLPDWAIIDLRTPPDSLWPGKVVDAGFFGESWELQTR